ncbi:hypothetical protein GEI7407_1299 [Geitlerinema sp. PCC 7407]|nr:hypothetical protein GEI7407_1299 [Geitlerinema sp. PCC 7407]
MLTFPMIPNPSSQFNIQDLTTNFFAIVTTDDMEQQS